MLPKAWSKVALCLLKERMGALLNQTPVASPHQILFLIPVQKALGQLEVDTREGESSLVH